MLDPQQVRAHKLRQQRTQGNGWGDYINPRPADDPRDLKPAATNGAVYNVRRTRIRRYLRTTAAAVGIIAVLTWAITQAVTWAVDHFLLTGGNP